MNIKYYYFAAAALSLFFFGVAFSNGEDYPQSGAQNCAMHKAVAVKPDKSVFLKRENPEDLKTAKMSDAEKIEYVLKAADTIGISALPSNRYFAAMRITQSFADNIDGKTFRRYRSLCGAQNTVEAAALEGEYPVLKIYDKAFEKILRELKSQTPKPDELYIWHLYNMGYIFKTDKICFAVDISHRRAAELAPCLDFLLVSHEHIDHYTPALLDAMSAANKPVISNFLENNFCVKKEGKFNFDGIEIYASAPVAHNAKLRNFVTTFELVFSKNNFNNYVFFHSADACNYKQLKRKTAGPCTLIPHLAVGLDLTKAQEQTFAVKILLSHILELGHDKNKWRWSVEDAFKICAKTPHCTTQMWGEKSVYQFASGKPIETK